nr:hypothetical protein [uncultured Psychroserpens sp.]
MELVFATNSNDKVILMKYVNPISEDEIVLDSRSTAQSLAMLHPWTMYLSIQARQEAMLEISQFPEFDNYHNQIIQGINNGELDPLANQSIIQAIDNFQGNFLNRVEEEKTPLLMVAENGTVNLTNQKSSLAYNLQLYDENNQPLGEDYIVDGVNKEILTWSTVTSLLSGNFDLFQPTNVQFPIPITVPLNNQQYSLKADRWEGNAKLKNGANITAAFVGILSTGAAEIIKNAECAIELGNFFFNNANTIIDQLTNGTLTTSQATREFINIILNQSNQLYGIASSCGGDYSIGSEAFKGLIKKLSLVGNLENGAVLIFNIADIAQYNPEIDFCFERNGNLIEECEDVNEIELSGCINIENTNTTSGECGWTELYYFIEENGSIFITNNLCSEDFGQPYQSVSYSFTNNNFTLNYSSSQTGTSESIVFSGVYVDSQNRINGNWNSSTTNNGDTTNCTGEFRIDL